MATSARPFSAARSGLSLFAAAEGLTPPPSERVVAAVLEFGDAREERADGLVTVRFTAERLEREDMALVLGEERGRARDVTILWNDAECEMVRVVDLAPLRSAAAAAEQVNRYAAARQRSVRQAWDTVRAAAA